MTTIILTKRSLLLGALLGGAAAALIYYAVLLVLNRVPGTLGHHLFGVGFLLCIAAAASGVLASIVGSLLSGFKLRSGG
ncbi:MAG: hypothetical protein AAF385_15760 [Pseudomonadota bacterium]